jgi:hypothetical protein
VVDACGCGWLGMVVADSAFVLIGLELSRASPLPQGIAVSWRALFGHGV